MEVASEEEINEVISEFNCSKNADVLNFIKNKAIQYEKINKSRTYFILDEDSIEKGVLNILAYFTIALKVLSIKTIRSPDNEIKVSNNKIRKLDGLSAKRNNEIIEDIPVFLIGQLAKNDKFWQCISGKVIIDYAVSTLHKAQEILGGRVILIECENRKKLINAYINNGFEIIRQDGDNLIQMIRIMSN